MKLTTLIMALIVAALSLSACTEAVLRAAAHASYSSAPGAPTIASQGIYRGMGSIFEQLAEEKRRQGEARVAWETYQREQARQKQWQEQVIKARAEVEMVLLQDRNALRQWIDGFNEWTDYCKRKVRNYTPDSYCGFAESLLAECQTFQSRVDFYLANLPAYIHLNMDVRKAQLEVDDYVSKRDRLEKSLMAWADAISKLKEELKKQEERLPRIEAEQRTF